MLKLLRVNEKGTKIYRCVVKGVGEAIYYKANGNGRKGYYDNQKAAEFNMNYDGLPNAKACEADVKKVFGGR